MPSYAVALILSCEPVKRISHSHYARKKKFLFHFQKLIYVRDVPGKGEGLFAKRNIAKGEQVAYYAGFKYNNTRDAVFYDNQTEAEM